MKLKFNLKVTIFLSFLFIIILAISIIAYSQYRTTVSQFSTYVKRTGLAANRQISDKVTYYYNQNQSWKGVDRVLEETSRSGYYIELVGPNGQILVRAGKSKEVEENTVIILRRHPSYLVDQNNRLVATLYVFPTKSANLQTATEKAFVNSINNSLIATGILTIFLSIILSLVLSQYISNPLRSLTSAVRSMTKGNLYQEVKIKGSNEFDELANSFNNLSKKLRMVEEQRRNMINDIAHELRTPLTTLQGNIEGMIDGVVAKSPKTLEAIHEETTLLSRLVKDLQELSLLEAGQLSLNKENTDIRELVNHMVKSYFVHTNKAGIDLSAKFAPNLPLVKIDKDRIRQVINNLVSNAIRHTSANGKIVLEIKEGSGFLIMSVNDTGKGIKKEDLQFIFERFYRVDKCRDRKSGGAGLGLTITKRLIEAHGGAIQADSVPEKGTTFTFTLPI